MRYQNMKLRLERLREAAARGGWTVENRAKAGAPPFWVCHHPLAASSEPRVAWAMMHGNEPTGYEAVCRFMERGVPNSNWTLLPLVNPTGIDAFTRTTTEGVDLNRQARSEGIPEADALKDLLRSQPFTLALNLHDQRSIFHPVGTCIPSSLSVLAPRTMSSGAALVPEVARRWAGGVSAVVQHLHPEWGFARFDDAYYPTAFGEWTQELGIPTVTIETGVTLSDYTRVSVGKSLTDAIIAVDSVVEPPAEWGEVYDNLALQSPGGIDLSITSDGEVPTLWKLDEVVIQGNYQSRWICVEVDGGPHVAYRTVKLSRGAFAQFHARDSWTASQLYAATSAAEFRDLAELLPK